MAAANVFLTLTPLPPPLVHANDSRDDEPDYEQRRPPSAHPPHSHQHRPGPSRERIHCYWRVSRLAAGLPTMWLHLPCSRAGLCRLPTRRVLIPNAQVPAGNICRTGNFTQAEPEEIRGNSQHCTGITFPFLGEKPPPGASDTLMHLRRCRGSFTPAESGYWRTVLREQPPPAGPQPDSRAFFCDEQS
mmetsp:Transcript_16171/g.45060  ORF Transcript_16171/g.45060 Transcript_16171/m.45060 type:complete len:188 (+) Transcript_16171:140-703(+)